MTSKQKKMLRYVTIEVENRLNFVQTILRRALAKDPVTRCNFSCNLSRNGVARQVTRVIAPFKIPCSGQNLCATSCMKNCTV